VTVSEAQLSRTVQIEPCMGTVFTIDVRDPGDWRPAVEAAAAWLHRVEAIFSTFLPDSDISRLRRGEAGIDEVDPSVADVLALCAQMSRDTGGYFSALTPAGVDPTGLVKGWAIERASEVLRGYGSRNHVVSGGGDMQLAGGPAADRPWQVGISDPLDRTRVLVTVAGRDLAIATSGTAERGTHIVNPYTGRPAEGIASVTVVGPSLTRVDVFATAAVAMGPAALDWLQSLPGHEALVVTSDGGMCATRGLAGMTSEVVGRGPEVR
jgi:thiamine biosynthesis lipoprotein